MGGGGSRSAPMPSRPGPEAGGRQRETECGRAGRLPPLPGPLQSSPARPQVDSSPWPDAVPPVFSALCGLIFSGRRVLRVLPWAVCPVSRGAQCLLFSAAPPGAHTATFQTPLSVLVLVRRLCTEDARVSGAACDARDCWLREAVQSPGAPCTRLPEWAGTHRPAEVVLATNHLPTDNELPLFREVF